MRWDDGFALLLPPKGNLFKVTLKRAIVADPVSARRIGGHKGFEAILSGDTVWPKANPHSVWPPVVEIISSCPGNAVVQLGGLAGDLAIGFRQTRQFVPWPATRQSRSSCPNPANTEPSVGNHPDAHPELGSLP